MQDLDIIPLEMPCPLCRFPVYAIEAYKEDDEEKRVYRVFCDFCLWKDDVKLPWWKRGRRDFLYTLKELQEKYKIKTT